METPNPALTEHLPATVSQRFFAKGVDLLIVIAVGIVLPRVIGPLLGFAYSLTADSWKWGGGPGQSIGKKIFNIRVYSRKTGGPVDLGASIIRNSPIGIATFFAIIPFVGWIIFFVVGLPIMIIELYLMATVKDGHRLGDVMADTEVRSFLSPKKASKKK